MCYRYRTYRSLVGLGLVSEPAPIMPPTAQDLAATGKSGNTVGFKCFWVDPTPVSPETLWVLSVLLSQRLHFIEKPTMFFNYLCLVEPKTLKTHSVTGLTSPWWVLACSLSLRPSGFRPPKTHQGLVSPVTLWALNVFGSIRHR